MAQESVAKTKSIFLVFYCPTILYAGVAARGPQKLQGFGVISGRPTAQESVAKTKSIFLVFYCPTILYAGVAARGPQKLQGFGVISGRPTAQESVAKTKSIFLVFYCPTILYAGVAEWQTRRTQNPLRATSCGFDSHHQHQRRIKRTLRKHQSSFYFFISTILE